PFPTDHCRRLPLSGRLTATYWTEEGFERTELLGLVIAYLNEHRWGKTIDSGWEDWDLEIYCHPWTVVRVCTAQEEHGSNKRLVRVRYCLRLSGTMRLFRGLALFAAAMALAWPTWPSVVSALMMLGICFAAWWRGTRRAAQAIAVFDQMAEQLGLLRCNDSEDRDKKSEVRGQRSEVRDQRSEIRGQKSEVRGQKSETTR